MTTTHTLKDKGAAFDGFGQRVNYSGTGGTGQALCSCGWLSGELGSGKSRVAAHKDHKDSPEDSQSADLQAVEPVTAEIPAGLVQERELPGNYSIVTGPLALELAKAFPDLEVTVSTMKGKLARRVQVFGDLAEATVFVETLDTLLTDTLDELHVWQKKTVEERKDQTDMQKFLGNREFITGAGIKKVRKVKKNRAA